LTHGQKDSLAKNFPSPPGIYPRKLRMCDAGKINQHDAYNLYNMKDKHVSTRPAPACICCVKEASGPLGLSLCCVNLVCIECIFKFSEKQFKGCPYCDANWAMFEVQEVFVEAPINGGCALQTKQLDHYRKLWMDLLQKYSLLEG